MVVSDIAKYDMGSSGEMTQGAGAVVMLLNDNPRLLSFDPKVTSTSIKDEYDFLQTIWKRNPHSSRSIFQFTLHDSGQKGIRGIYKKKVHYPQD